jgi:hypothetical protein
MLLSWYLSYPISISNGNDYVFNHVSILYWISLPLLMVSMFFLALTTHNNILKWVLSVGIFLTFYSITLFYGYLPGADSQYFRGLNEYYLATGNLDASQLNHDYYQWPAFFDLAKILTSISGLDLSLFDFILFFLIGFLITTALFVYAYSRYRKVAYLSVIAFFFSIFYFFNYQAVPFSLGLAILFLMFMIEIKPNNSAIIVTTTILFLGLVFTHLFVPLFYVMYLFFRGIIDKNRFYLKYFLLTLTIYVVIEFSIAKFSLIRIWQDLVTTPLTYGDIVKVTIAPITANIDIYAQMFSRSVTLGSILLCVVGFIFLLLKRKLKTVDKALLLTGSIYAVLGTVLNILGWRSIAIVFIPLSLGAVFLFESAKFRKCLIVIFSLLLVFSVFLPMHQSLSNLDVQFQTTENHYSQNFLLDHYSFSETNPLSTDYRISWYLQSKLNNYTYIWTNLVDIYTANGILLTPSLVDKQITENMTIENVLAERQLSVTYNDGSTFLYLNTAK